MSDLQNWMATAGFTDAKLAGEVGVSRVQINRIRNGKNKPSVQTAVKLEQVTGIPAASFIFGDAR